jgi:hypothetical protein
MKYQRQISKQRIYMGIYKECYCNLEHTYRPECSLLCPKSTRKGQGIIGKEKSYISCFERNIGAGGTLGMLSYG